MSGGGEINGGERGVHKLGIFLRILRGLYRWNTCTAFQRGFNAYSKRKFHMDVKFASKKRREMVDLTLEKFIVKRNSRLSFLVSKSKKIILWQKDFVPKKSTKLNKEEIEKLSYAIDETKTFFNISQFYHEVFPTAKTSHQRRQCERRQDFSILHLASQGCYSVHSNRLQKH